MSICRAVTRAALTTSTLLPFAARFHVRSTAHPLISRCCLPLHPSRTMSTSTPTYLTLSSGSKMPFIGLGLWKAEQSDVAGVVEQAVRIGYRHFDSASDYGNEKQTGEGLKRAMAGGLVKREELFVTSKLWCTDHAREHVQPALERILSDLQLDYLDLFLIHFPISLQYIDPKERYPAGWSPEGDPKKGKLAKGASIRETWEAMEALLETGKVKNIGISNFNSALIGDLLRYAKVVPACNQIELHPLLPSTRLVQYCQHNNIQVVAFSPFGQQSYLTIFEESRSAPSLLDAAEVKAMAAKHGKTSAQVLLRWSIQRGVAAVPKSTNAARLKENLDVFGFALSDEEMKQLETFNKGVNVRFNNPGVFGGLQCAIWD